MCSNTWPQLRPQSLRPHSIRPCPENRTVVRPLQATAINRGVGFSSSSSPHSALRRFRLCHCRCCDLAPTTLPCRKHRRRRRPRARAAHRACRRRFFTNSLPRCIPSVSPSSPPCHPQASSSPAMNLHLFFLDSLTNEFVVML